nr:hypothetical protein [Tanacetum cinerariifolium]
MKMAMTFKTYEKMRAHIFLEGYSYVLRNLSK